MAHFKSEKKLKNWEKIIPNQPFISDLYNSKVPIEKKIFELIFQSCQLRAPKEIFKLKESDLFSVEEMSSSPVTLNLIKFLIKLTNPLDVLEIGTFVGVASMMIAKEISDKGRVITIEKFERFSEVAAENFKKNRLSHKISLINGDANEVLNNKYFKKKKFDFIFIDGAKENYDFFLLYSHRHVKKNGLIFIDDALFHGDVLNNKPKSKKGKGVKKSMEYAKDLKNFEKVFLPMSNGIMILRKK